MKNLKKKLNRSGGFTLVEMLIVVAIIAILIAVSIPLVSDALDQARKNTDAANLRSAKAEGAIVYMMGSTDLKIAAGTDFTLVYNAGTGKLVDSAEGITNYAQKQPNSTDMILVTASAGVIDAQWKNQDAISSALGGG